MTTLTLYHGTAASSWAVIREEGLSAPVYLTISWDVAYYYAVEAAESAEEDAAVILAVEVPVQMLKTDYLSIQEPVLFGEIDRDEILEALRSVEPPAQSLLEEAEGLDDLVQHMPWGTVVDEEDVHAFLGENWPEPSEWQRSLVISSAVVVREPIPPEWVSLVEEVDVGEEE